MNTELIRMEHISKEFPGVRALNDVKFQLNAGEVHALVGENGAGKSTLMKILTGMYIKDEGDIYVRGEKADIKNISDSQKLGIAMIHQELNLMQHLTVAQNIFIGRESANQKKFFINDSDINRKAGEIFEQLNLKIDPTEKVGNLTVAMQQMVEIAKALSYNSAVLIMDEPTASLTDSEIEDFFAIVKKLRADKKGIIHISHRLEELKIIADRISVMRDAQYIDTLPVEGVDMDKVVSMMVGREILVSKKESVDLSSMPVVLEVKELKSGKRVKNVSFSLKRGEILGVFGLVGAGRTEMARVIFGADACDGGEIMVNGNKLNAKSPYDVIQSGIAYLSEDRKRYGISVGIDIENNIAMADMKRFSKLGFVDVKSIRQNADEMIDKLRIKTPSVKQLVRNLSGGNQQKVVIAKWLTKNCEIMIFDEPTRGIDIGAKNEIYKLLSNLAEQGKAIIFISSELPEIIRMSNRVIVMCEGVVTGELTDDEVTQDRIMMCATNRVI